jgi:hypothetical protein
MKRTCNEAAIFDIHVKIYFKNLMENSTLVTHGTDGGYK